MELFLLVCQTAHSLPYEEAVTRGKISPKWTKEVTSRQPLNLGFKFSTLNESLFSHRRSSLHKYCQRSSICIEWRWTGASS